MDELLCEECAEVGFKLGKLGKSTCGDTCLEVMMEVVAVEEGVVVVPCVEGSVRRNDTAGDESD